MQKMTTSNFTRALLASTAALAMSGAAQAELFDRGGGMVYDSELDITWLKNWNQAVGSSYDTISPGSGRMTWTNAKAWADNLVWGGFDDWRLPTMIDTGTPGCNFSDAGGTDCGYNVQTKIGATVFSEMAHLHYVSLGNKAYCPPGDATCAGGPQLGWGLVNTGPFTNKQPGGYWSGLEYAPDPQSAWGFGTGTGRQGYYGQGYGLYAVAVRPGDVAAAVPEPQTWALLTLGVTGLLVARRRRTP
jgi:Protein of unknown function (DUF1566)/PEP-CTERM motif